MIVSFVIVLQVFDDFDYIRISPGDSETFSEQEPIYDLCLSQQLVIMLGYAGSNSIQLTSAAAANLCLS
jgi:hypothetical protein